MKTALLVDDNDELRSVAREYLEDLGYAVTAAGHADEALRVAPDEGFGLLVSDVYMPGMNGIELADRLLSAQPELAVLLFSSRGGEPEVRRRLARGDVAFLPKPFSPDELAARVGDAFDRVSKRRRDEPPAAVVEIAEQESKPAKPHGRFPWRRARLAGALVVVLGLGALARSFDLGAPPLPAPAPGGVTRGAIIEIVQPFGPQAEAPTELVWLPVAGASSYAVSLRRIDGSALWQAEVLGPPAAVPSEVERDLHRAVTYYWSVEGLDAERKLMARSELAPFVTELEPQESPPSAELLGRTPRPCAAASDQPAPASLNTAT